MMMAVSNMMVCHCLPASIQNLAMFLRHSSLAVGLLVHCVRGSYDTVPKRASGRLSLEKAWHLSLNMLYNIAAQQLWKYNCAWVMNKRARLDGIAMQSACTCGQPQGNHKGVPVLQAQQPDNSGPPQQQADVCI